ATRDASSAPSRPPQRRNTPKPPDGAPSGTRGPNCTGRAYAARGSGTVHGFPAPGDGGLARAPPAAGGEQAGQRRERRDALADQAERLFEVPDGLVHG